MPPDAVLKAVRRMPSPPRGMPADIWAAIEATSDGKSAKDIATAMGRSRDTVRRWIDKFGHMTSLAEVELAMNPQDTRYVRIMRRLFDEKWSTSSPGFEWERTELKRIANGLGIEVPENLGDNIYSIRHGREDLPREIRDLAPSGRAWVLLPNGRGKYKFVLAERAFLDADESKEPIKIPDSTPQIVARYAKDDEQAVLARIRYCRLVDIFMGLASFQLQSHMRTTIAHFKGAQTELDEIYVGVDGNGTQFVIPIQAKGHDERIGVVQIITDHFACAEKFPGMLARTVAAKMVRTEEVQGFGRIFTIALVEAVVDSNYNVRKRREEHFKLVPSAMITQEELDTYRSRYRSSPA
jgi:hypothetical protein